jgi:outer membrane lipoprotein-sorting protein
MEYYFLSTEESRKMNLLKRTPLIFALLTLTLAHATAHGEDIRTGDALLRAMHDRYQSSWYKTVTFTQESTTYKPDGTHTSETWYEAALLPGKLRIDVGPPANGNGYVLSDGTVSIVKNNKVEGSRPLVNILLVLGFDVYTQAPETTIKVVQGEGYDLTKLREDTWEGHPAYVVGADKGDLTSRQFWVTKDTLLFVRVIEPTQSDPKKLNDIRFTHYRHAGHGWIAARVEIYSEDKLVFSEDYTHIKPNAKLEPAVYDPQQFSTTHWEKP